MRKFNVNENDGVLTCDVSNSLEGAERPMHFYFGDNDGPALFGSYHKASIPPPGVSSNIGVVICNPFGFEEVAGHRGIRQLAIDCAAKGFACLRFDYLGCGNSHLGESDISGIGLWLKSIDLAVAALKQLSDVQQIVLVGFRLGAALAVLSSIQRSDVCGLIAVSPVISGRRFVRELRLLSNSLSDFSQRGSAEMVMEPNGFLLTAITCEAIEQINLLSEITHVGHVLIVDPPGETSGSTQWARELIAQGNQVEQSEIDGYVQFVEDPQTSVVPLDLFARIIDKITTWRNEEHISTAQKANCSADTGLAAGISSPHIFGASTVFDPTFSEYGVSASSDLDVNRDGCDTLIRESVVDIPTSRHNLFGVMTQPAQSNVTHNVILLNAGKVRNIGPNRFWVNLARLWAHRGFRVLRLDVSGIGESPSLEDSQFDVSYAVSALSEIAAAEEYMRALDNLDVHLVGLCSGGYQALRAASEGLPIMSVTLINPLAFDRYDLADDAEGSIANYQVLNFSQQYRKRISSTAFWTKLVKGRLDSVILGKIVQRRFKLAVQLMVEKLLRGIPGSWGNDIAADFDRVLERGVLLNLVFAEEDPGYQLLLHRLGKHLKKLLLHSGFKITLIPDADHTFTQDVNRRHLLSTLEQFFFLEEAPSDNKRTDG